MSLSDKLTKLTARANELEASAEAAKTLQKADLEQAAEDARDAAQAQTESLRKHAEERTDELSKWWDKLQREWNEQMASIPKTFDEDRTQHDFEKAQGASDLADEDAASAIEYAYAAIAEVEYAVLKAALANMEADALAGAVSAG